jgi:hypothetical protein
MPKEKKSTDRLKHYLRSAWYWQKKKELLSDKIEVLRSRAEKITTSYQDVPSFGGYADHRQAVIDEMVDTQAKYKKAVAEGQRRNCAVAAVDGLEEVLKRNCKVLAICDKQLADAIKENLL